ncbi:hypothetical protein PLAN_20029 [Planktothrix rubescens CCAP 1459/22]|uniref:Uncharacterized protein n=1 Tax=Planktothrix rubescens CCAP 1459/22 TaxID=329571 RepID=A0A6J7ZK68_PLARU|nr:hypothetical protein PLAN_20029 [Planktothrix rubescens NIVA-CYA 18]
MFMRVFKILLKNCCHNLDCIKCPYIPYIKQYITADYHTKSSERTI